MFTGVCAISTKVSAKLSNKYLKVIYLFFEYNHYSEGWMDKLLDDYLPLLDEVRAAERRRATC